MPHEKISVNQVKTWIRELYNLEGEISPLYGYANDNFKLTAGDGKVYIVKLSFDDSEWALIKAQNDLLQHLNRKEKNELFPYPIRSINGNNVEVREGRVIYVLSWLQGNLFKDAVHSMDLFNNLGKSLGKLNHSLNKYKNPEIGQRFSEWDLQHAMVTAPNTRYIDHPEKRRLARYFFMQFENKVLPELPFLRKSIIHGDINDYNILVDGEEISGIIDFGDTCYSPLINEVAIALAYALMDKEDPIEWAISIVSGYHSEYPLLEKEIELLYYLVAARLVVSVTKSAVSRNKNPENDYLLISEIPAWSLLNKWIEINPVLFENKLKEVCGFGAIQNDLKKDLLKLREEYVNPSLSISYKDPIAMHHAGLQYMYSEDGKTYLDCVNNICHVGHCHPNVVSAGQDQMAQMNTNTRYLYGILNDYAEQLASKFPDPLDTFFFVNSGSEAGDLAQRIARTVTGQENTVVVDHAYHGNTIAGIEVSPYKYQGKGGKGKSSHIYKLDIPDGYRGSYKYQDPEAGLKYAKQVDVVIEDIKSNDQGIAAFYCESIIGCGGQVILPDGYLQHIYSSIRKAGGLCIADEVQVGFGRVGEKFWAFELQEVVPDIVVIGKPMGNGHPLAAVVTTKSIADKFNNGMEYFSSFGGNPVSCTIGLEVLKVIEEEDLQEHAGTTGNYFKERLAELAEIYPVIGDVRGFGLFLGIEFVKDRTSLDPATSVAGQIVEQMKDRGILLSTDGPYNNVIKIKPPLVFNKQNVDQVVRELENVLLQLKDK